MSTKSTGLGDTVKKLADATGISTLVGGCNGCDERQRRLNEWFPYRRSSMITPLRETPLPDGPEQIIVQTIGNITLTPKGVISTEALQIIRFRAMKDGTNPKESVDRRVISLANPPKEMAGLIEKLIEDREALYQTFLHAIGE